MAAGLVSALFFLLPFKNFVLGVLPFYATPLPIMMVGLSYGWMVAVIASVIAAAAVATVAGGHAALPFLLAAALPALVTANRASLRRTTEDGQTEWYPPGLVLAWLTGLAVVLALFIMGAALLQGHPDGIKGWVIDALTEALESLAASVSEADRAKMATWLAPLFPSMAVTSWLVVAVLNAVGAQALLARFGHNARPTPPYRELWLPDWMGIALAAMLIGGAAVGGDAGYIGTNAAAVLLTPFFFLGLAAIHRQVRGKAYAKVVLTLTYGLLFLVMGWAELAVTGLGLVRFLTMRFRRSASGGGMEK